MIIKKYIFTLLIITSMLFIVGCEKSEVKTLVNEGISFMDKEDYSKALELFNEALNIDSKSKLATSKKDVVEKYLQASELYNTYKFKESLEMLKSINEDYKDLSIVNNIDKLKEKSTILTERMETFNTLVNEEEKNSHITITNNRKNISAYDPQDKDILLYSLNLIDEEYPTLLFHLGWSKDVNILNMARELFTKGKIGQAEDFATLVKLVNMEIPYDERKITYLNSYGEFYATEKGHGIKYTFYGDEEELNKALDAEKKKEEEEKLFAEEQGKINNLLNKLEGLISSNDIKSAEALINEIKALKLNPNQDNLLSILIEKYNYKKTELSKPANQGATSFEGIKKKYTGYKDKYIMTKAGYKPNSLSWWSAFDGEEGAYLGEIYSLNNGENDFVLSVVRPDDNFDIIIESIMKEVCGSEYGSYKNFKDSYNHIDKVSKKINGRTITLSVEGRAVQITVSK